MTTHDIDLAVRATGLVKQFGDQRAVDHVDLEVHREQEQGPGLPGHG